MSVKSAAAAETTKHEQSLVPVSSEDFSNCRQQILELIARRAYEMFESRGRTHGYDQEDWFKAESEKLRPLHAELSDAGHSFVAVIAVPGGHMEHLKLGADARSLWICGPPARVESKTDGTKEGAAISGPFLRSFRFPAEINPSKIRATIREDLILVSMPKAGPQKNG